MTRALPAPAAADLLVWYDRSHRRLPWRIGPAERAAGRRADPYRVWLSEVMLQQTTVAAVTGYFEAFTRRWENVAALAAAEDQEVMSAWAGLGYYSRARNLLACARTIVGEHGGRFPNDEEGLSRLPGIGPYTAAAIAAIAFEQPAAVVDGNVERVFSRLFRIETPLPASRPDIRRRVGELVPADRPGDFAQATMDLGATVCTPRRPACAICPWTAACRARAAGIAETLPRKAAKAARPTRRGTIHVALRADGAVLLRRRPAKGLLGGMSEPPGTDWIEGDATPRGTPPVPGDWETVAAPIVHVFTHFRLEAQVMRGRIAAQVAAPEGHWWAGANALTQEALPTVFRKAIEAARSDPEGP